MISNIVDNDVVKRTKYNKLVSKVNSIGTSGFVLKTTDKSGFKKKIDDSSKKVSDTSVIVNRL